MSDSLLFVKIQNSELSSTGAVGVVRAIDPFTATDISTKTTPSSSLFGFGLGA